MSLNREAPVVKELMVENYEKLLKAMCIEAVKVMFNGFFNRGINNKARKEYLVFREYFLSGKGRDKFIAAGFADLYPKIIAWYEAHEDLDSSRAEVDKWKDENGLIFGRRHLNG